VLDIGAWDGFFSFEAERRGAKRVVALDHYVWSLDFDETTPYREKCRREGIPMKEYHTIPEMWHPDTLPGQRGFNIAREALRSKVEPVVADFMEMDLSPLGTFDVVLYLGVLYHMKHPLLSLQRLASVTKELAIIETAAIVVPGYEHVPICEFYPGSELGHDATNWWAPNARALVGLCHSAGFRRVEVLGRPPRRADLRKGQVFQTRAVAHAYK
jgi:tRNA (mo5U34)-methyltransferase